MRYGFNVAVTMGTTLVDSFGIQIRRFCGGKERGTCYQVSISDSNVQLTEEEYWKFLVELFLTGLTGKALDRVL